MAHKVSADETRTKRAPDIKLKFQFDVQTDKSPK